MLQHSLKRVACAISGGVDSAVSAYLLKNKGFQVVGVFMKNWDAYDENLECSINADRDDAKFICHKLGIEFCELNFVKQYWNDVFIPALKAYQSGQTPNPDIQCNRFVKFKMLAETTLKSSPRAWNSIDADSFATGHYAQNSFGNYLENKNNCYTKMPLLLRSVDPVKDQTFWLCNISAEHLRFCMFPIGHLNKPSVKKIAIEIGLEKIASRPESMGMCFIGKRRFRNFIDNYIEPQNGYYRDYSSGKILGEHNGVHHFTIGQRAPGITQGHTPFYIANLNSKSQDILLVQNKCHPALFMKKITTSPTIWISGTPSPIPSTLYKFQWQNKWRAVPCNIEYLSQESSALSIELNSPMRCISAGQQAVLYDDNICLGGAVIKKTTSLADEGCTDNYKHWNLSDYEIKYTNTID